MACNGFAIPWYFIWKNMLIVYLLCLYRPQPFDLLLLCLVSTAFIFYDVLCSHMASSYCWNISINWTKKQPQDNTLNNLYIQFSLANEECSNKTETHTHTTANRLFVKNPAAEKRRLDSQPGRGVTRYESDELNDDDINIVTVHLGERYVKQKKSLDRQQRLTVVTTR